MVFCKMYAVLLDCENCMCLSMCSLWQSCGSDKSGLQKRHKLYIHTIQSGNWHEGCVIFYKVKVVCNMFWFFIQLIFISPL